VLIAERISHVNRVKGLLFSQGVSGYEPLRRDRRRRLDALRTGDGRALPTHFKAQIGRELDRLELLLDQIKAWSRAEGAARRATGRGAGLAAMLLNIKGIGPEFAAVLWLEGLFRHFDNRRQVASYAGLAPTPGKAGRSIASRAFRKPGIHACEPRSFRSPGYGCGISRNRAGPVFKERVTRNGGRFKKSTIVALARKLLVALWKYVTAGVVIEGAVMKSA